MDDTNSKTLDQVKLKVEEVTDRIWRYGIRYGCGDSVDVEDLEYICGVAEALLERIDQLEHERNMNPIVKCRDCKYWEGGMDENIYADWCSYLERATACDFYCAKGKKKHDKNENR